jgi:hypothetical protein
LEGVGTGRKAVEIQQSANLSEGQQMNAAEKYRLRRTSSEACVACPPQRRTPNEQQARVQHLSARVEAF